MDVVQKLKIHSPSEEFDYNFLLGSLSGLKYPRDAITKLLKAGKIVRVKKGLYIYGDDYLTSAYSKEILANLIYGPSYISLEYALSYYGMIPERVETVTCITNKKNKAFNTPVGLFTYQYLKPEFYSFGVTQIEIAPNRFALFATKEKALADKIFFERRFQHTTELSTFLNDNMRIKNESLKS